MSAEPKLAIEHVRTLFAKLHAMYGNAALDRYRTGQTDRSGADLGVLAAQRQWHQRLQEFAPAVLIRALGQCEVRHKTYAPTLPEFVDICKALARSHIEPRPDVPALPISPELRSVYAQRVRQQLARLRAERAGDLTTPLEAGRPALLALAAHAAGLAGADEASVLMRLESTHCGRH